MLMGRQLCVAALLVRVKFLQIVLWCARWLDLKSMGILGNGAPDRVEAQTAQSGSTLCCCHLCDWCGGVSASVLPISRIGAR